MNEAALKERLKVIANNKSITFNEAWKQLLLERFLARLSHSEHQEKFIFKGGLLLAQYLVIGRETTDADFLMTKLQAEIPVIKSTMNAVVAVEINDGFNFSLSDVEELNQPHMDYPGFRVSLDATFGKMKDKVQVDIGVGDLVDAISDNFQPFEYKGKPIFEGEISLLMYPVETIFAEKLETIASKGTTNSRMKDYHDIILIAREADLLDIKKTKNSIVSTFKNRGTKLSVPLTFEEARVDRMQTLWSKHLNGLGGFKAKLNLPEQMTDVLSEINSWLSANGIH